MWITTFWLVTFLAIGSGTENMSVMRSVPVTEAGCKASIGAEIDSASRLNFGDGSHPDYQIFAMCVIKRIWQQAA